MAKYKHAGENAFTMLITLVKQALGSKVDKVDGKGLSTNDYTTEEKTKLSGIATGANKTVVEDNLTSTNTGNALSANQGKVLDEKISALEDSLGELGYGDMLKSTYDQNGDGIVDQAANAAKLGNVAADQYALKSNLPTAVSSLTNDADYQSGTAVDAKIKAALVSALKPKGSSAFAELPVPSVETLGFMYNVTDAFTTTAAFLEGSGKKYPSGTNVYVIQSGQSYLWDILPGFVDLSPYVMGTDITELTNEEVTQLWNSVAV